MSSNSPISGKGNNLPEIASEAFILIIQLRSTSEYGEPASLKNKIIDMLDRFEKRAKSASIDNEKIYLSKFALIAFLDESIISSEWNRKDAWLSEPLQLKLFDTFNAGEEFFTNLDNLRQRTASNRDVLEIYYLCLTLGFKGKYQLQSPENLRRIIDDLNLELHPEMYKAVDSISPQGNPSVEYVSSSSGGIPVWVYPLAAIIIIAVLEVIFSLMVSGNAESTAEALKKLL